ncbi:MAG: hypothetical protein RR182_03735 [Alistipes sp.]
MKKIPILLALLLCAGGLQQVSATDRPDSTEPKSNRIVNIINFIRQLEPRDPAISEEVLYETVHQQVLQLNRHQLAGTFLLQYDALINPRYQKLLKEELNAASEVGAWWEITQPHVEAAGLKWRGRYPWDWHADVGFSTGYTPAERAKLVDVYMAAFKAAFGTYPASVGSWFIDAYTLGYMYDKYHIVASCNCKDQLGTDGYTLWGGYWNQAYYPSRKNAYMPAQTEQGQIPVPIFRMLGSDPIYQYDLGLGSDIQGVASLEPVYNEFGKSRKWIEWFFRTMFDEPCLAFNYVQAGQENSFTWAQMRTGLEIQIPLLDSLRRANKIEVKTLKESGEWFRKNYTLTPPTAVTALTDVRNEGHKTVWYNSRFYRANLLWRGDAFRFRDIHLFDEHIESVYFTQRCTSNKVVYKTLPLVDGFLWSTRAQMAGLRVVKIAPTGESVELPLRNPVVEELGDKVLRVTCDSESGTTFTFLFREDQFEIRCDCPQALTWALELQTATGIELPFTEINRQTIRARQDGIDYAVGCHKGSFQSSEDPSKFIFRILPTKNRIIIDGKNAELKRPNS